MACLLLSLALVGCSGPAHASRAATVPGQVQLWQDASIFKLIGGLIERAQKRVLVEVYELGREDIVHELGNASARGLDVRVVTDPTVKESHQSAALLASLRVPERFYPVDDARHQIDHVKLLIADGEAVVGGMNWGRHSHRNHDYVLETRIAIEIDRLARIFEQDWSLAGGKPAPLPAVSGDVAQTIPGEEIRAMLRASLVHARQRVLAEVYTLTDPEVVAQLVSARQRGVDVRVLLDPNQVYNRHAFTVLGDGGVDVRWYPVQKGELLHAKIGLFDGLLILGSANWTLSGLGVNHELDIETGDAGAVGAYLAQFNADWERSAARAA